MRKVESETVKEKEGGIETVNEREREQERGGREGENKREREG